MTITTIRVRCVGNVARMGEMINAYRITVEKAEGKRLLGDLDTDGSYGSASSRMRTGCI
jgi:hypothetical protein